MIRRRSVLAAGGAVVAALAGCSASEDGDGGPGATTPGTGTVTGSSTTPANGSAADPAGTTGVVRLPFDRPYDTGEYAVELSDPAVRDSVFYEGPGEVRAHWRLGVYGEGTDRFLWASVDATGEGDPPPAWAYRVEAGGETFGGWNEWLDFEWGSYPGEPYEAADAGTLVGFVVPGPLGSDPELVLDHGEARAAWSLPPATVEALAAEPPEWELRSHRIDPDPFPGSATVEVANVGDGDGTFRMALVTEGNAYYSSRASFRVPAGETRTATAEFPEPRGGSPLEGYVVDTIAGGFDADAREAG